MFQDVRGMGSKALQCNVFPYLLNLMKSPPFDAVSVSGICIFLRVWKGNREGKYREEEDRKRRKERKRLIGWLVGRLVGWLVGWLVG